MSAGAIAERYARALLELGTESGNLPLLVEKLGDFARAYEDSKELRSALGNPTYSEGEKTKLLSAVAERLQLPPLGLRGLLVMATRGRLPVLSATIRRLTELSDEKNGILRAKVTTASAMPASYYEDLSSRLAAATGKKIVLERHVNGSLVGGSVAQVGDLVIDGSVRGQLEKFERELLSAALSQAS